VKVFFPLLLALSFLLACQPASNTDSPPTSNVTDRYWRMSGFIGNDAIIMDLNYRANLSKAYQAFHGSYFLLNQHNPIDFYGQIDSSGSLILNASGPDGENITFSGNLNIQNASFSGACLNSQTGKSLPFRLKEDYSGDAVPFSSLRLEKSIPLFPEEPGLAYAECSSLWLLPNAPDDKRNEFLHQHILKGMTSLYDMNFTANSPQEAFNQLSETLFAIYTRIHTDATPAEVREWPAAYISENNISTEIVYNHNQLLTLGFWNYEYAGGAHGNYATTLITLDLQSRKPWTFNDVFASSKHPSINIALDKAVRHKYQIPDNESLMTVLTEETVPLTQNIGLTSQGILFYYAPYEIAPFAVGEIKLFIPFSEVSEALTTLCKERFAVR